MAAYWRPVSVKLGLRAWIYYPVTPEGWPKASTGKRVNPSEHFTIFTPAAEIDDRSLPSARYHAGLMRQPPWWPWMRMGQSGVHGVLMGRMHSYKVTGTVEDIPRTALKGVERERPDLLENQPMAPMTACAAPWKPMPRMCRQRGTGLRLPSGRQAPGLERVGAIPRRHPLDGVPPIGGHVPVKTARRWSI
ncbi:DUF1838 family protein [Niveispirillum lacus]|uniref:DUF1838 family protein n=1 Tax=Niveispirillum lacus TaxID=1981099 RepID=UPI000D09670A